MYIQPFWVGFICGCIVMVGAFVTLLIHAGNKAGKQDKE